MKYDLSVLKQIIISAANEELLPRFADVQRSIKTDGSFVTEADLATQARILRELKENYPGTTILGEEMTKDEQSTLLTNSDSLWCLDPLDGTKEFIKRNGEFTVNIALVDYFKPVLGVVYAPVQDILYFAAKGIGSYRLENPDIEELSVKGAVEGDDRTAVIVADQPARLGGEHQGPRCDHVRLQPPVEGRPTAGEAGQVARQVAAVGRRPHRQDVLGDRRIDTHQVVLQTLIDRGIGRPGRDPPALHLGCDRCRQRGDRQDDGCETYEGPLIRFHRLTPPFSS